MSKQNQPGIIRRTVMNFVGMAYRFVTGSYVLSRAVAGLGGAVSIAGVKVNRTSAFKLSAFLRGVTLIANYVGKTPTCIYKGRVADPSHPGHPLVRWWARKDWLSAFDFQRILTIHALVAGNGYGFIDRDRSLAGGFKPAELRVLEPSCVVPYVKNGVMRYRIYHRDNRSKYADADAHEIIHIRGIGWDELCGDDPLVLSPDPVAVGLAQQQFAEKFLEKNGVPALIAEYDQTLEEDEWQAQRARLQEAVRSSEAIVSDAGGKIKPWNMSADQMQLLQSREFTLVDIANLLNLAASKLNAKSNTSYKSLEEDNRSFREDTLDPWFCQFEIQFRKLLTEAQQATESHHIEFQRMTLVQTNIKEKGEYLSKAVGGPWMTPNQAAEACNLPDIEGGNELYPVQGASPDAGVSAGTEADDEEPEEVDEADERQDSPPVEPVPEVAGPSMRVQVRALTRDYSRICKRLSKRAQRAAKKSTEFMQFLEELDSRCDAITEEIQPTIELCGLDPDQARTLATLLVTELRSQMQTIYDTAKPDAFQAVVTEAAVRFEEAGSRYALETLAA